MLLNRKKIYQRFPGLLEAVRADQERMGMASKGHNFLHALTVAQYAALIAQDDETAILAFVAGMLHNADYLFGEARVSEHVAERLKEHTTLGDEERRVILEAVVNHSKLNDPADHPVTVTLKDADRLANTGAQFFIRVGQHRNGIPALDPVHTISHPNPSETYKDPHSVATLITFSLEWEAMLRLPKAKKLGKKRFEMTRACLEDIEEQLKEIGLYPYLLE